jgi:hypothetical protein
MRKSIRPGSDVRVSSTGEGRVLAVGKRKQGGAWVRTYRVRLAHNEAAIRTVAGQYIRPSLAA